MGDTFLLRRTLSPWIFANPPSEVAVIICTSSTMENLQDLGSFITKVMFIRGRKDGLLGTRMAPARARCSQLQRGEPALNCCPLPACQSHGHLWVSEDGARSRPRPSGGTKDVRTLPPPRSAYAGFAFELICRSIWLGFEIML